MLIYTMPLHNHYKQLYNSVFTWKDGFNIFRRKDRFKMPYFCMADEILGDFNFLPCTLLYYLNCKCEFIILPNQ